MTIKIISLGRVKQAFVLEGESEYLKRLKKYCKVEAVEIEVGKSASLPEDECKEREASALLGRLKKQDFFIVLDEDGKHLSSREVAKLVESRLASGAPNICLAIGGAYGWHPSVKQRADFVWSLSRLTFTYQMTRLILTEQLYRAFTIIKGEPYHK